MAEFKCKKFTEAEINSLPKQIREFYDELYELSNGFASFYLKADEIAEQDKTLFNIISKNLSEKKTEAPKKAKKDKSGFIPKSKGKKPVKNAPVEKTSTKKTKQMARSKEAGIINSFIAMVGKRKTPKNYEDLLAKAEKAIENGENTERLKYIKSSLKSVLKDGQTMFTLGKVGEKLFSVAILEGINDDILIMQKAASLEELKKLYKKFAFRYHPDKGGSNDDMKAINNAYDKYSKIMADPESKRTKEQQDELNETFKNLINLLLAFDNIEIEIVGDWIWVSGETFQIKDALKEAAFKWSSNRKMWYWHDPNDGYKGSKKRLDFEEIRVKYGSEKITKKGKVTLKGLGKAEIVRAVGVKLKKLQALIMMRKSRNKALSGFSVATVAENQPAQIQLPDYWEKLFGNVYSGFYALIHGAAGSGKSSLLLLFANFWAKNIGNVAYISFEEGRKFTMSEKISRLGIDAKNILIFESNEEMKKNGYNCGNFSLVIIDSLQAGGISPEAMRTARGKYPKTSFITVSQQTKNGKFRGSNEFSHDSDVVIEVANGMANSYEKNRLGKGGEVVINF